MESFNVVVNDGVNKRDDVQEDDEHVVNEVPDMSSSYGNFLITQN